jgi:hypothetical protein
MFVGFIAWKIGCDFGFLIVNTSSVPWSLAFSVAGLIPYAVTMYVVYYLIGQKMIIQGQFNPFAERYVPPKVKGRPSIWKQFLSKFFHESMNATSANVPLRQVFIKPAIDYGAILISWPIYNIALLFSQSGEVTLDPLLNFTFLSVFVFYVVNVLGFIVGFNLGEFIYFRIHYILELFKRIEAQVYLAQKVDQLWTIFDEDGDGSISAIEFRKAMRSLGQDPTNAELFALLQEADLDRSGSIEFDEFRSILVATRGTRRTKLLLGALDQTVKLGLLDRLSMAIALQWQVLKNNTLYIRFQGFLRRYGLNNRWLLSGSLGLIFIMVLEPSIAGAIFSWSDRLQHAWFYHFGQLDTTHLTQVFPQVNADALPDPLGLTQTAAQQIAIYLHPPTALTSSL